MYTFRSYHKYNEPPNHHQDRVMEHFQQLSGIAGSWAVQLFSYAPSSSNEGPSCPVSLVTTWCCQPWPFCWVRSSGTLSFEFVFPWGTMQLRTFSLAIWVTSFVKCLFISFVHFLKFEFSILFLFVWIPCGLGIFLYFGLPFHSHKGVCWKTKFKF